MTNQTISGRRIRRLVLAFCLILPGVSSPLLAKELTAAKRAQVDSAVATFMKLSKAPGVSIAIVEDNEISWAGGFGMADLENSVPANQHTLYRLASISKSLTATAAMQLWERNQLDLDAPIQKYCPAFPVKEAPITTRMLLGHLGGIRHYKSDGPDDPEGGNTKHFEHPIQAGLDFFKNDPLVAKPGTEFHYSTQGFTVVGCAIEGASGKDYVDYVFENVFKPANMNETRADDRTAIVAHRTRFYHKTETGKVENADFLDSSYKIPGGGWLSSSEDMAKFEIAILQDRLMRRSTRDAMWTAQVAAAQPENPYALGWGTLRLGDVNAFGHSGGQQGTSTYFMVVPQKEKGVVVLANMDEVDARGLAITLMKIVLGGKN